MAESKISMLGLNLSTLVQMTDQGTRKRSQLCQARVAHTTDGEDGGVPYMEVISIAHCKESKHSYVVTYRFSNPDNNKISMVQHPTWVRCSCPSFLYRLEVALSKHGSSDVYYSNGRYPMIRNPKLRPYLCKHLMVSLSGAVNELKARKKTETLTEKAKKIPEFIRRLLRKK